jgi:hypothetical protein
LTVVSEYWLSRKGGQPFRNTFHSGVISRSSKPYKQSRVSLRLASLLFLLCTASLLNTHARAAGTCSVSNFNPPVISQTGALRAVAVGDFNGDAKMDVAVGNYNANTISILIGDGAGSFAAAVNVPVNIGAKSVAAGDFNGDGKLYLAAT